MLGGEPILTRDGGTLTDGHGHHPYVTTAGSAPSLGKHVLLAYLPPEQAVIGNELAVSYMEELYPVTVGSVDATPAARPGQRADALMTQRRWSASSGSPTPPSEVVLTEDGAVGRRPVRRLHDERPRGVRGRARRPGRRRRPAARPPC